MLLLAAKRSESSEGAQVNPHLLKGDIVFVMSDGLIGWLIRKVEGREMPGRTYVNHVALVVEPGPIFPTGSDPISKALILDAQPPKVRVNPLNRYQGDLIAVYRPKNMSIRDKHSVVKYALDHYDGHIYGFSKVFLHLIGLQHLASIDRFPICSWPVSEPMYAIMSFTFGGPANEATPESMLRFCRGNSAVYDEIVRLGIMERGKVTERRGRATEVA